MTRVQDQLGRAAGLGLLLLLLWLVIGNVVLPLVEDVVGGSQQVGFLIRQRDALAAVVSRRPSLLAEQRAVEGSLANSHMLWDRSTDAETAARIQGIVRAAMPPDGQITSISEGGASDDHRLRRITLRFEASSTLDSLTRWIAAIEKSTPSLFLDRLSVSATPQADPTRPPYVSIECDLSAYSDRVR